MDAFIDSRKIYKKDMEKKKILSISFCVISLLKNISGLKIEKIKK